MVVADVETITPLSIDEALVSPEKWRDRPADGE